MDSGNDDLDNENHNAPDVFPQQQSPPEMKVITAACLFFLTIGLLIGGCTGRSLGGTNDTPAAPATPVTQTPGTSHPEPKVVIKTVPEFPSSCLDALQTLQKLLTLMDEQTTAQQQQRDIASDAYVAIGLRDLKKLVQIQQRQNDLNNRLSGSNIDIQEQRKLLNINLARCKVDLD